MRTGAYLSSASPVNAKNLLTECNLIALQASTTGANYLPLILAGNQPTSLQPTAFEQWWNQPILKDNKKRIFSRKDLVLNVANTDGGAHIDPDLEEAYMSISRKNSLGWQFKAGESLITPSGRPEMACMRQIAFELTQTIHMRFPKYREFT